MNTEELLKTLDANRDAYVATLLQLHEALARTVISSTSPPDAARLPSFGPAPDRISRRSLGESERKSAGSVPITNKTSFISGGDNEVSDSDDDEALYVQDLLPSARFDDEDLRSHLKNYHWNDDTKKILQPILTGESRMRQPQLFLAGQQSIDQSHCSLCQVFDVGSDGAPLPLHVAHASENEPGQAMWRNIKEINIDKTKRQAVGRITILREPTPTEFAAIHLTMNELFDMDEIFTHLVEQSTTKADITRAYSEDPRKQRSIVFSFEYFTIIGDECFPMSWQQSDQERERPANHIPISRCCSVVALSFAGKPYKKIKNSARRAKTQHGYIYSPWSPWHVLNVQCYPDWKSNTESHDSTKHYVNGPEAFLNTLLVEYKDAQKRFEEISHQVTKLVTPPAEFMFNGRLRDKLLFEDENFTYSRRYFWAFQTLGAMNQSIKGMVDAYEDTFTRDVWEGRHKTLWPLPAEHSGRNIYWKKRMALLKKDFEDEIQALNIIMRENDVRRKEIRNLRDNLFSGSSVLESRKSVEQTEITVQQGRNIKLLTLVNMFFLPLTFVTSVFGMTNMDPNGDFWRFGVTMVTVCIPFFLLIGSMNTSVGMRFWREQFTNIFMGIYRFLTWTTGKKMDTKNGMGVNGSEVHQSRQRSQSASEGMARRMGRTMSLEKKPDSNRELSLGTKNFISLGKSISREGELPMSSQGTAEKLQVHQRNPSTAGSPQPMMMTALSATQTIAMSESTERSDTPASSSKAARRGDDLGIWKLLRSGGKHDQEGHQTV